MRRKKKLANRTQKLKSATGLEDILYRMWLKPTSFQLYKFESNVKLSH